MKLENPSLHTSTLEHFWMPFTANRQFKAAPRLLAKADGMYYWTPDGRQVLDGTAGLWCVNAGHNRKPIVDAVQKQAATMDYAPPFSMGHPLAFEAATAVARVAPAGLPRSTLSSATLVPSSVTSPSWGNSRARVSSAITTLISSLS